MAARGVGLPVVILLALRSLGRDQGHHGRPLHSPARLLRQGPAPGDPAELPAGPPQSTCRLTQLTTAIDLLRTEYVRQLNDDPQTEIL